MKQLFLKNLNINVKGSDSNNLIIAPSYLNYEGARTHQLSISGWNQPGPTLYLSTSNINDGSDLYPIEIVTVPTSYTSQLIVYDMIANSPSFQYFNEGNLYYIVTKGWDQSTSFPIYFMNQIPILITNGIVALTNTNETIFDKLYTSNIIPNFNVYLSKQNNNFSGEGVMTYMLGGPVGSDGNFDITYDDILAKYPNFDGSVTPYFVATDNWVQISAYPIYLNKSLKIVSGDNDYIIGSVTLNDIIQYTDPIEVFFTSNVNNIGVSVGTYPLNGNTSLTIPLTGLTFNSTKTYYIYTSGGQYTEYSYYFQSSTSYLYINTTTDSTNSVYDSLSISGVLMNNKTTDIDIYLSTTQSIDQGFKIKRDSTSGSFIITTNDILEKFPSFDTNQLYYVITIGDYTQFTSRPIYFKIHIDVSQIIVTRIIYTDINIDTIIVYPNTNIFCIQEDDLTIKFQVGSTSSNKTTIDIDNILNAPEFNPIKKYYFQTDVYNQTTLTSYGFFRNAPDLRITYPFNTTSDTIIYGIVTVSDLLPLRSLFETDVYLSTTTSVDDGFIVKSSVFSTFTLTFNDIITLNPLFDRTLSYYIFSFISDGNILNQQTSYPIKIYPSPLIITNPRNISTDSIVTSLTISGCFLNQTDVDGSKYTNIYLSTINYPDSNYLPIFIKKTTTTSSTITYTDVSSLVGFVSTQSYYIVTTNYQTTQYPIKFLPTQLTIIDPDPIPTDSIVKSLTVGNCLLKQTKSDGTKYDNIYLSTASIFNTDSIFINFTTTEQFTITYANVYSLAGFDSTQSYYIVTASNQSTQYTFKFQIDPLSITSPKNTSDDTIVSSLTIDGCLLDQTTPDGTSYNDMLLSITPILNTSSISITYTLTKSTIINYQNVDYLNNFSLDNYYYIVLANGQCTPYAVKFQIQALTITSPEGTEADSIVSNLSIDGCLLDQTNSAGTSYNDMFLSVTNLPNNDYSPIPITYTLFPTFTVTSDIVYSLAGFDSEQPYYIITGNYQTTPHPIKFKPFLTITDPQGTSTDSYVNSLTVSGCLLETEFSNTIYLSTTNVPGLIPLITIDTITTNEVTLTYADLIILPQFDSSKSYYIVVGSDYKRTTLWPIKFRPPLLIINPPNTLDGDVVNSITVSGCLLDQSLPDGTIYNDMYLSVTNVPNDDYKSISITFTESTSFTITYDMVSSLEGFSTSQSYYITTGNYQSTKVSVKFKQTI